MTVFELERGVQQMERRDAVQGQMLRRWLDDRVMVTFGKRILPLSGEVALRCAGLHIPDPRSERDAWIAATAIDGDLILATRNMKDFEGMGVNSSIPLQVTTDSSAKKMTRHGDPSPGLASPRVAAPPTGASILAYLA